MVTGSTSGIGRETARGLAQRGARVILVSRSAEKCTATMEQIKEQTGNDQVDYLAADLSAQAEIRDLVQRFYQRYDRLDVLINNAGGFFLSRRESVDGIEMTVALNHLNYFLLTNLLLDTLIASGETGAASRIINVSSDAHRGSRINFNDLHMKRRYSGMEAYGRSKLANVLFTYELDRRLAAGRVREKVTVNALHPGFVRTNLAGDNGPLARIIMRLVYLIAGRSPERGAETSVYLASSREVEGVSGKYFVDCEPVKTDPVSHDEETAKRLWQVSARMVDLKRETL